jgi:hypothetical protein
MDNRLLAHRDRLQRRIIPRGPSIIRQTRFYPYLRSARQSLAQRALGYSYHAEKAFQHQGEVMKVQYVEHVPPDVAAAKFWLLNRRRAEWSDTSRHELTGANGGEIEIRERSDLDRARRIAYILSQAAATKTEP